MEKPKLLIVEDETEILELYQALLGNHFETTGVDALRAEPLGVSFSWKEKEATYVAFRTADEKYLPTKETLKKLAPLFEDPKIRKIGQNIKYEAMILGRQGIRLAGIAFDTMVASYCLNPAKPNHTDP